MVISFSRTLILRLLISIVVTGVGAGISIADTIFFDGFESGDTTAWNAAIPIPPPPEEGEPEPALAALSVTTDAKRSDTYGLEVFADGFSDGTVALEFVDTEEAIEADVEVTVSFWVACTEDATFPLGKAPTPSDPERTQVSLRYGANPREPLLADSVLNLTAGVFTKVEVSFTPSSSDLAMGNPALRFKFDGNGEASRTFYFDDFLIESADAPVSRPDIRIGKKNNPNRTKGNNVYNGSGAGQKLIAKTFGKRPANAFAFLENDGDTTETLVLSRTKDRKFKVKVLSLSGGGNVTAATRSGYGIALDPGSLSGFKVRAKSKKGKRSKEIYRFTGRSPSAVIDVAKVGFKTR